VLLFMCFRLNSDQLVKWFDFSWWFRNHINPCDFKIKIINFSVISAISKSNQDFSNNFLQIVAKIFYESSSAGCIEIPIGYWYYVIIKKSAKGDMDKVVLKSSENFRFRNQIYQISVILKSKFRNHQPKSNLSSSFLQNQTF
jgi:hypothetical protein